MDILPKLLKEKGFRISADRKYTKVVSRGPNATTADIAEYINECRSATGFVDYKIVPDGSAFIIATDYTYANAYAKLDEYANALVREDIANHYADIRFDRGSFCVVVVGGKLAFKYVMLYKSMFNSKSEHTDERPALEKRIIEYAMKILPKEIRPKET